MHTILSFHIPFRCSSTWLVTTTINRTKHILFSYTGLRKDTFTQLPVHVKSTSVLTEDSYIHSCLFLLITTATFTQFTGNLLKELTQLTKNRVESI